MAWMPLTGLDVKNELAQPELDVFNSSLLEPAQTDRLTSIASWVASMVRGRVAAFPQNRNLLDPVPANIPPELYGAAIEVARFKLLTSFPQGKAFLDDARIATYKDACKQLDDVAKGLIAIEQPPTAQFDLSPSAWNSQDYQGLPDASGVINTPNKWRQGLDASFWH
jgi:hypothetical protein